MSDDAAGDDANGGGQDALKKHAVVLAKVVWRDQLKERGIDPKDKEVAREDWKGKKPQYVALSRRILRQLDKQGYALHLKTDA